MLAVVQCCVKLIIVVIVLVYLPEVSLNKTKGPPVCEPLKGIPTSQKSPLFVEVVFNVVCIFVYFS